MRFFIKIRLDTNFLNEVPSPCTIVRCLKVVNDNAEREVVPLLSYFRPLAKDEEQLQILLQVVSEHWRVYHDVSKNLY